MEPDGGSYSIFTVVYDTDEGWYPLATFHNKPDAEALVAAINPLLTDIDFDGVEIREETVRLGPVTFKGVTDIIDFIGHEPAMEDIAFELDLHRDAMESSTQDYPPEKLALWQVEPKPGIEWPEHEEPSMEMGL